jgi:hypothetical protein
MVARLARLSLLLALAAPLSAQNVPFSSLHAKVTGVRFFPSPKAVPDAALRFYPATLDSATTQYIDLELSIDYPAATAPVGFSLQCTYVGPGGVTVSPDFSAHIDAGWTSSMHVGGWGSETPGTWAVGPYTATCKDGQTVVATGNFTVSRDQFSLPDLHGVITNLAFFESPVSAAVARSDRKYMSRFSNASTRGIFIELGIDYPKVTAASQFAVECTYQYPDDRKFNVTLNGRTDVGWTGSWISGGIGFDQPGQWALGTYHVECRYQGRAIAVAGFIVQ